VNRARRPAARAVGEPAPESEEVTVLDLLKGGRPALLAQHLQRADDEGIAGMRWRLGQGRPRIALLSGVRPQDRLDPRLRASPLVPDTEHLFG